MGSQIIQGRLCVQPAADWACIPQAAGKTGYDFVPGNLSFSSSTKLVDTGCGTAYLISARPVAKAIKNSDFDNVY